MAFTAPYALAIGNGNKPPALPASADTILRRVRDEKDRAQRAGWSRSLPLRSPGGVRRGTRPNPALRFVARDFLDAARVATPFEFGVQPDFHHPVDKPFAEQIGR